MFPVACSCVSPSNDCINKNARLLLNIEDEPNARGISSDGRAFIIWAASLDVKNQQSGLVGNIKKAIDKLAVTIYNTDKPTNEIGFNNRKEGEPNEKEFL